jgi:hypothetical protein
VSQPTPYARAFSFTDYTTIHPTLPQPGVSLDSEFNALGVTLAQVLTNLALIQRDDGKLANNSVGIDQLASELDIGIHNPTTWVTTHAYIVRDVVWVGPILYRCVTAHTSGVFATDLAAAKWVVIADFSTPLAAYIASQIAVTTSGPAGADGLTLLNGAGAPAGGTGVNGDFYIRTSNWTIYGPKAAGAWGAGTSLVGAAGTNGTNGTNGANGHTVLNGSGVPAGGTGADGDFYIDTNASRIYGPKTAGAWGAGVSIIGATGATGADGPAGAPGSSVTSGIAHTQSFGGGITRPLNRIIYELPVSANTMGAAGDAVADDRAALLLLDANNTTGFKMLSPGSYRVASNMTLNGQWIIGDGAYFTPDAGVVVTLTLPPISTNATFNNGAGTVNHPHLVTADTNGDTTVTRDLAITRNTTVGGTLAVTGLATVGGAFTVTGLTTLNGGGVVTTRAAPTAADIGFLGTPQNTQAASYSIVMADIGETIRYTGAGGHTFTYPANGSIAIPPGAIINVVNEGSGNLTIAITTDTLKWLGSGTGSRTLAPGGSASLRKDTTTAVRITGDLLT